MVPLNSLSLLQKDHVRVSLEDLMGRYSPPVPPSRYRLSFVPVVGSTATEMARDGDSGVGLDGSEEESCASSPAGERMRGHLLRTARYCWCDRNTRDLMLQVYNEPLYKDTSISRTLFSVPNTNPLKDILLCTNGVSVPL